jgi:hypothetical protein
MRRLLALLAVGFLVLAACSDDDSGSGEQADTAGSDAGTDDTAGDTTSTTAAPGEEYTSEIYGDASYWICRPGMSPNPCEEDLDVTVVNEDGSTEVQPHVVADDPPFDCFYVYPTINLGSEGNAPFDGEYGLEQAVTVTQAARLSSLCDLYAPVYRQVTMGSMGAGEGAAGEVAYGDVVDAFRHYIANDNDGRPFVLLGHSQGSGLLTQLIAKQIDGDVALRNRMISALIIGAGVAVPEGEDVGGSFQNVPACRSATQTGCVVSYMSFRATAPPPPTSFFGKPWGGEGVALCTNPAALDGGSAELSSVFPAGNGAFTDSAQDMTLTTPFVSYPGLLSAECVSEDGFTYLSVTVNGDPSGPRTDDIEGDMGVDWGLHGVDYNIAMNDLVDLVDQQSQAWLDADG